MGFKDNAKGIATALRLDSHHAIERFGVFFAFMIVTFLFLFIGGTGSSFANQSAAMDSRVLYTPTFATSKTQLEGDVPGVYVNSEHTRALVLMHFEDATSMSADAAKYQAFLTGSANDMSEQSLQTNITGKIVVFGSTGYMGMVLESDQPFPQQILNLTMRANSELVYLPSESRKVREDLEGQKTFSEYDQWRLFFNPGASEAVETPALDSETFDAAAVYNELVVALPEEEQRKVMDEQLAQMQADLARIAEYESEAQRVQAGEGGHGLRLVLPEKPKQIAGDVVTGTPAVDEEPSTLALDAKWVSPRGYDFDWRSGSVSEGYLEKVMPKGASYVTWLAEKVSREDDSEGGVMEVNDQVWKLNNGELLFEDYPSDYTPMQPLFEIANGLSQAYQDYYQHKLDYQVGAYSDLINLEVELLNVRSSTSINDAAEALFTY